MKPIAYAFLISIALYSCAKNSDTPAPTTTTNPASTFGDGAPVIQGNEISQSVKTTNESITRILSPKLSSFSEQSARVKEINFSEEVLPLKEAVAEAIAQQKLANSLIDYWMNSLSSTEHQWIDEFKKPEKMCKDRLLKAVYRGKDEYFVYGYAHVINTDEQSCLQQLSAASPQIESMTSFLEYIDAENMLLYWIGKTVEGFSGKLVLDYKVRVLMGDTGGHAINLYPLWLKTVLGHEADFRAKLDQFIIRDASSKSAKFDLSKSVEIEQLLKLREDILDVDLHTFAADSADMEPKLIKPMRKATQLLRTYLASQQKLQ